MAASQRVFGIHSVQSALDYGAEKVRRAWIDRNREDRRIIALMETLSSLNIPMEQVDRDRLYKLSNGGKHQGIVLEVTTPEERGESDLKDALINRQTPPLFLVLDRVQDPHNFGACLRTADATGVDGIIITKDQTVGLTPTVCKVASGAAETMPVYRVVNLARTLRWLKTEGVWIVGADGESERLVYDVDLREPTAIIVGAEGKGLRRLTREQCDLLIKLPMHGHVESLNLSAAAAALLYEAVRQRSNPA
ncbi:MAG: 23S rRNA (guanosine(2251)-2'-O)-methyltransferase RlmB [Methylococcales bacterium]